MFLLEFVCTAEAKIIKWPAQHYQLDGEICRHTIILHRRMSVLENYGRSELGHVMLIDGLFEGAHAMHVGLR